MRSKGNAPTAAQKRFYGKIVDKGCIVCGRQAEIHHVVGASARSNKIKVGNWYVLPLCYWHHRDPVNDYNVTNWKNRFEESFGTQHEMFTRMLFLNKDVHGAIDLDVMSAIADYVEGAKNAR